MSEATKDATLVLQIMPELQELCGESSVVPPMELRSLDALVVATTPSLILSKTCQLLASVDSGGSDASDTQSSVSTRHVVSLSNEVDEAGVLASNSDALFAKELSDLLISLETVSPGYGMEIASVLAGKASKDIIRKVEKSLRTKRKKMVFTWKVPQQLLAR
jgi:hypothetical protein